jgi:pimeloyl-ACP methyl ester carboxylesterase
MAAAAVLSIVVTGLLPGAQAARAGHAGGQAQPAASPVTAQGRGLAAYRAAITWGKCAHSIPAPFQCGTVTVPLSYSNPAGAKIHLLVVRLPASDPTQRIGSLFVNFGGPGGPGVTDLVSRATTVFSAAIRARFDLVSWDPRGIQYSDPVNCFATAAADQAYYRSLPVFPYPTSGAAAYYKLAAKLGTACAARDGALLKHVSTADTARDLDLLRQDVGDAKLSYLGFSYGTVIGASYANLFPGNVRGMVLDGTLDFVGNATGHHPGDGAAYPIDVRQGVDQAGQDVFNRFLSLCAQAGTSACPFAAGGNLPAKWAALLQRAQAGALSYRNLMIMAFYDMENPIADWPGLASNLQHLYTSTAAGRAVTVRAAAQLAAAARRAADQSLDGPYAGQVPAATGPAAPAPGTSQPQARAQQAAYSGNGEDAFYAIQCADSLVPASDSVYSSLATSEDAAVPGFGRLVVYDAMPCATWPDMHTGSYDGPWNSSATPILVINAEHDPFTPLAGAQQAVAELGNARLLTVAGDGHTSMYVEPSSCRDAAELAYLVSGTVPAPGTVCPVDKLPFGLP